MLIDKKSGRVTPQLEYSEKPKPSDLDNNEQKNESSDQLQGYCMDGNCALPFSSLDEDVYIDNSQFESIGNEDNHQINSNSGNLPENTSDKHNKVNSAYENMLKERENI